MKSQIIHGNEYVLFFLRTDNPLYKKSQRELDELGMKPGEYLRMVLAEHHKRVERRKESKK